MIWEDHGQRKANYPFENRQFEINPIETNLFALSVKLILCTILITKIIARAASKGYDFNIIL